MANATRQLGRRYKNYLQICKFSVQYYIIIMHHKRRLRVETQQTYGPYLQPYLMIKD